MPGHRKSQAYKDKRRSEREVVNDVTSRGQGHKDEEGTPASKSIGKPAAGILIDCVEEMFGGSEEADDWRARAKSFEILRQKLFPKLFAKTKKKNCG